ncbi:MAG: DinB family protein [Bacteroidia bacterium]|nr:DinB family protein [Bacteroidia bacterium]
MNKQEILNYLLKSHSDLNLWVEAQDNQKFGTGPDGKWSTGQHVDHLIQSALMLTKGIKTPKFILKYKFGKPNRKSRDLETIKERYKDRLDQIPLGTPSPTKVRLLSSKDKDKVLMQFSAATDKLITNAEKWTENQLDAILLPHPLMGKMTVREILIWCAYHNYHHLNILKEKY